MCLYSMSCMCFYEFMRLKRNVQKGLHGFNLGLHGGGQVFKCLSDLLCMRFTWV